MLESPDTAGEKGRTSSSVQDGISYTPDSKQCWVVLAHPKKNYGCWIRMLGSMMFKQEDLAWSALVGTGSASAPSIPDTATTVPAVQSKEDSWICRAKGESQTRPVWDCHRTADQLGWLTGGQLIGSPMAVPDRSCLGIV